MALQSKGKRNGLVRHPAEVREAPLSGWSVHHISVSSLSPKFKMLEEKDCSNLLTNPFN